MIVWPDPNVKNLTLDNCYIMIVCNAIPLSEMVVMFRLYNYKETSSNLTSHLGLSRSRLLNPSHHK